MTGAEVRYRRLPAHCADCPPQRYEVIADGVTIGEVWKRPGRSFSREWRGHLADGGRVVDGWTRAELVADLIKMFGNQVDNTGPTR